MQPPKREELTLVNEVSLDRNRNIWNYKFSALIACGFPNKNGKTTLKPVKGLRFLPAGGRAEFERRRVKRRKQALPPHSFAKLGHLHTGWWVQHSVNLFIGTRHPDIEMIPMCPALTVKFTNKQLKLH